MTGLKHTLARRAIRGHFGRGNGRRVEHWMFGHLSACDSCSRVYERYADLAAQDPDAPSREERLLRGLGMGPTPRAWRLSYPVALAACGAAVLLFVALPWSPGDSEFRARSVRPDTPAAGQVLAYRITDSGSMPVVDRVAPSEPLAFTYTNPKGAPYLLIFAIGADREVHWYYPAWTSADENPAAIAVPQATHPRELGEAVVHALSPGTLTLVTAFADRPFRVRDVEQRVAGLEPGQKLALPGTEVQIRTIRVE